VRVVDVGAKHSDRKILVEFHNLSPEGFAPTVETIEIALTTRENAITLHLPTILMSVEASSE
jgi:hypothetical protein